jgi:hypothetical protein
MQRPNDRLSTDDLAPGGEAEREPSDRLDVDAPPSAPAPDGDSRAEEDLDERAAEAADRPTREEAPAAPTDREDGASAEPLVDTGQAAEFRGRWESIQTSFVDEPRRAVEQADALVAELMQQLAETFSRERKTLEGQWDRGDDVSTEDLRVALRRYRSFFDRLLSA